MECRFEDRLAGRALRLAGDPIRIEARSADAVAPALREIERARAGGRWIALLLDYELGEWLLPEALRAPASGAAPAPREDGRARLTALAFERAEVEAPWPAPATPAARIVSVAPRMARDDYLRAVDAIRELIAAGELYQVNYTQPLDVRIEGDPACCTGRSRRAIPWGTAPTSRTANAPSCRSRRNCSWRARANAW